MKKEVLLLSEDRQVTLTAYLHERSGELPIWQKRPVVLVLPGGGYTMTSDREADPVALSFLAQGFHAFVLRYSVGSAATFPNPLCDVLHAMRCIQEQAQNWDVRTDQIAVCGFSAGGHLAANLGTLWNDPEILAAAGTQESTGRPDALILCYPLISALDHPLQHWFTAQMDEQARAAICRKLSSELHVGTHTPPTFLFHTYEDELVPVEHSLLFAQALVRADIPFEMHLFQHGAHGISLANELSSSGRASLIDLSAQRWFDLAATWLWRLFGKPRSLGAGLAVRVRAHPGDPISSGFPPDDGERYVESGRFTLDTALGDLLDNPRARVVLERFQPELVNAVIPDMARGMSLRSCLVYSGEKFPEGVLETLSQELVAIAEGEK